MNQRDLQSRYAAVLMQHFERFKRYPRELREAGIEGQGLVEFRLGPDGRIVELRMARSTGSPALDRQVRSIFERAQPFPVPDWSLQVAQARYAMPVGFTISR